MTTRKPLGPIGSTLILTGLAAGVFVLLAMSGGVLGERRTRPGAPAAAAITAPTTRATTRPTTDAAAPVTSVRVSIDNFSFSPAVVTVSAGTNVTWINHDDVPHT